MKLCEELNFQHKFINFYNECLFLPVFHGSDNFYLTTTGGRITYYPTLLCDLNMIYEEQKIKHGKSFNHRHRHKYKYDSDKNGKKMRRKNINVNSTSVLVTYNKFVVLGKIYMCKGGRNHFLQEYILSIYKYVKDHDVFIIILCFII